MPILMCLPVTLFIGNVVAKWLQLWFKRQNDFSTQKNGAIFEFAPLN